MHCFCDHQPNVKSQKSLKNKDVSFKHNTIKLFWVNIQLTIYQSCINMERTNALHWALLSLPQPSLPYLIFKICFCYYENESELHHHASHPIKSLKASISSIVKETFIFYSHPIKAHNLDLEDLSCTVFFVKIYYY